MKNNVSIHFATHPKGLYTLVGIAASTVDRRPSSSAPRAADDRNMIYERTHSGAFTFVNVISVIIRLFRPQAVVGNARDLDSCVTFYI